MTRKRYRGNIFFDHLLARVPNSRGRNGSPARLCHCITPVGDPPHCDGFAPALCWGWSQDGPFMPHDPQLRDIRLLSAEGGLRMTLQLRRKFSYSFVVL